MVAVAVMLQRSVERRRRAAEQVGCTAGSGGSRTTGMSQVNRSRSRNGGVGDGREGFSWRCSNGP
jgi:hypothetical protein